MALPRNTIIAIAAAVIVVAGGIGAYFWLKSPSEDAASTPAAKAANSANIRAGEAERGIKLAFKISHTL